MAQKWNIVIVGAGIGGLATALSIARKSGHNITVLETSPNVTEAGAGVQIGPNASRILTQWGLRAVFEETATVSDFMEMRNYKTNDLIGLVAANRQDYATRIWGSPHWLMHRARYQQNLASAATETGKVMIRFSSKVSSIDVEQHKLIMEDGSTMIADLVIGADGIHSRTRRSMPSMRDIQPIRAVNYCYRTLIPREKMMSNDVTAAILDNQNSLLWAGHNKHVIGYPLENSTLYNLVLLAPDISDAPLARYNQPAAVDEMFREFADWHPAIKSMLQLAESCTKWTIAELPALPSWSSDDGRVVLMGDAAHAMTPHAASGAATTLEDAEVLGHCIASCSSMEDLPKAIKAYENIRKRRCERIQEVSRLNATTFSMPDGPGQQARDHQFSLAMKALEIQLAGHGELVRVTPDMDQPFPSPALLSWIYGYDAAEEARAYLKGLG